MVDFPPLKIYSANSVLVAPTSMPDEAELVAAIIKDLPGKIADIVRQIQLNGPIINLLSDGTFTIQTAVGDIKLFIAPPPGETVSPYAQQLTSLAQNQRPLGIFVQPGQPPTQALLWLPETNNVTNAAPTGTPSAKNQPSAMTGRKNDIVIAKGAILSAIIIPNKVGENFASLSTSPYAPPQPSEIIGKTTAPDTAKEIGPFQSAIKSISAQISSALSPEKSETVITNNKGAKIIDTKILSDKTNTANPVNITFTPGTELKFRVNHIIPAQALPEQIAAAVKSAEAEGDIIATVIGNGPSGQMLLNANENTFYVRQSGRVPIGAKIVLTIIPTKVGEADPIPVNFPHPFTNLSSVMRELATLDPVAARQVISQRIPQPNAMLAGTMMFLLSAFYKGDLYSWLGDNAAEIISKSQARDLLEKLMEEFKTENKIVRDTKGGEWRSIPVPIHDENQFQIMHFYVRDDRQHRHEQEKRRKDNSIDPRTRFLINLNMTRLGALQMDGLAQKKKLDIIIRSERPLPDELLHDIRIIYNKTMTDMDYAGTIKFQIGRDHWLKINDSSKAKELVT
ncbi:MAG: hypothetical protein PHX43_06910 [Alphaproteobacteria bacterium]|nr:hypothetical protein [Alphaproteobacteria bacterium]